MALIDVVIVSIVLILVVLIGRNVIQSSKQGKCSGCGCGKHASPNWFKQYQKDKHN